MLSAMIKWIAAWTCSTDFCGAVGDDRCSAAERSLAYDAYIRLNVRP